MRDAIGGASICAGGSAISSSEVDLGGQGLAIYAFDGLTSSYWVSDTGPAQWIGYHFASSVEIVEIALHEPGGDPGNPTTLSLEYSDDGSAWTAADTWSGAAWASDGWQAFTRAAVSYTAAAAGTPRRPSGALVAAHYPPHFAAAAGTPRRPSGALSATHYPPRFAAAAGSPRRPSGALVAAHTFRPPPHLLRTSYALILTGAEDGTTDIDLPLISWQAVASLDGQTVVQCVVPYSPAIAAQLAARPAGTLRIDQRLHYGGEVLSGTIVSAPWDGAPRTDRGGRSQSITLQGRADAGPSAAKLVRLSGVQYLRIDDSGATVRAAIDFFAAPGDALDYGDGTLIASRVTWICTPALSWMEANG